MIESPHKHFKLLSIALKSCAFEAMDNIDEVDLNDDSLKVASRRGYGWRYLKRNIDDESRDFFQAEVGFGFRLIDASDELNQKTVYSIEAIYVVEFEVIDKSFDESELGSFADKNATHLAWPYWRLHVSQTLQAANLPQLMIPLLAPARPNPKKKRNQDPKGARNESGTE